MFRSAALEAAITAEQPSCLSGFLQRNNWRTPSPPGSRAGIFNAAVLLGGNSQGSMATCPWQTKGSAGRLGAIGKISRAWEWVARAIGAAFSFRVEAAQHLGLRTQLTVRPELAGDRPVRQAYGPAGAEFGGSAETPQPLGQPKGNHHH